MTKKSNAKKKPTSKPAAAAPPANANASKAPKKGAQLKIANTGRIDADEEIEAQSELVRKKQEARMALEIEERAERKKLTELIKKKRQGKDYIYEDEDGEMRRAYVPKSEKEPQAKVQKLKKHVPDVD